MLELIAVAIALVGGFAAGLWDLKTTDIPDEIPALMVAFGLFLWYIGGMVSGNWQPFIVSAVVGTVAFAIGWALYKTGQWGGGDAALIAGTFYLLADVNLIASYMLNFFIVAVVYMVVYSIALGVMHPKIFSYASQYIRRSPIRYALAGWIVAGGLAIVWLFAEGVNIVAAATLWLAIFALLFFYLYAKAVEKRLFRRIIPVSELRVGDVLTSSKQWVGLTAEEIKTLRSKRHAVGIKEGVRFGMVFPLTLVVTLILGNLFFLLLGVNL